MSTIRKGDFVQIENVVMKAGERAPQVPEDTQKCDLKMWVKGLAMSDCEMGDVIDVKTVTGRIASGKVVELNPRYIHDYGEFQPELLAIELQLKDILFGGEN